MQQALESIKKELEENHKEESSLIQKDEPEKAVVPENEGKNASANLLKTQLHLLNMLTQNHNLVQTVSSTKKLLEDALAE
jgi:hypothetical protein